MQDRDYHRKDAHREDGFFSKATATTNDKLKLKLKAKLETGELGNGHENNIFGKLAFTLSWRPTDPANWRPEAVEFYTKQTAGRQLINHRNQHLSLSGNDMDYESHSDPTERTLTLWYKASWGLSDVVPREAPKMNVMMTLDRVLGNAQSQHSYTTIKSMSSMLNPVVIRELRFRGETTSKYYHELKNDDETITYRFPQWVDLNGDGIPTATDERNYPFGFTRNSKPLIGGEFKVENLKDQNLSIKAESSQRVTLAETSLMARGGGNYRLDPTEAATGFVDTVEFYDAKDSSAFRMNWSVKLPGLSGWHMIGSTKHTVCVTKADLAPSLDSRQETLFVLACKNAKTKTADPDIIAGIWGEFTDRVVNRVDGGLALAYYRDYTTKVDSTRGLIKNRDGQCGAWCSLFVDMLKVHGIDNVEEGREIRCKFQSEGFMVKNWHFGTPSGSAPYPYQNRKADPRITPGGYSWITSEVTDLSGVPGQGRNNPASLFANHFIVQIGSNYYDPSYGKTYTSPDALDGEMAGFWKDTPYFVSARKNLTFNLAVSSTIDTYISRDDVEF